MRKILLVALVAFLSFPVIYGQQSDLSAKQYAERKKAYNDAHAVAPTTRISKVATATPVKKTVSINPSITKSSSTNLSASARIGNCLVPTDESWSTMPVEPDDDDNSIQVNLPFNFVFYGNSYNKVWINNNGSLSFGAAGIVTSLAPPFPVTGQNFGAVIAGLWCDVDTRNPCSVTGTNGLIYYKVSPTNLMVTWQGVGRYDKLCDTRNTFQIIIGTTNDPVIGLGQNLLLNYGDIQWAHSVVSDANDKAVAGFDAGDGIRSFTLGAFKQGTIVGPDNFNNLDNQCYAFNVTNVANIAPAFAGAPDNNTITLKCGETINLPIQVLSPEVDQVITASVNTNGLCSATAGITNNGTATATVNLSVTGAACNMGTHIIQINATDNGIPSLSNTLTLTVVVTGPEINVKGNSISIIDGDNTPSSADNTDFGSTTVGIPVSKTFVIENTGSDVLNISNVSISGVDASSFTIVSAPASVAPNSSANLVINFTAAALGQKTATINIVNDDCDEGVYNFDIKALAITAGPALVNNGILLWLDASDVDADGNAVNDPSNNTSLAVWKDKSGLLHNATTLPGQNNVAYLTNQVNGKPVVHFTRVNDNLGSVLETAGVDIRAGANPDITIFTVYKPGTHGPGGQGQSVWGNDDGNWDRFYYSSWNNTDDGIASLGPLPPNFTNVTGAGTPGSLRLLTAVYDGNLSGGNNNGPVNGSAIYFNGAVVITFTDQTHPTLAKPDLRIGWDGDNGAFNGDIAEMIVYNRKLTDCEILQINQYLGQKYGVIFTSATITPAGPSAICAGSSVTLTASAGTGYVWSKDGAVISGAVSSTYAATQAGSYTVTISNGSCSATSLPSVVTINPSPTATVNKTDVNCAGGNDGSITITASGASAPYQYSINGGAVYQAGNVFTGLTAGNYNIVVKSSLACTSAAQIITVGTKPDVTPPVITLNSSNGALTALGTVNTYNTSVPGSGTGGLAHAHGIAYDLQRNTVWVTDQDLGNQILEFPATQPGGSTLSPLTRFTPALNNSTIEGIAFDATDNSLWVNNFNGLVRHIDRSNNILPGSFSVAGTVPAGTFGATALGIGIQDNFIWIDNGVRAYKFNKADGSYAGINFATGQPGITYDPERHVLWSSGWNDGRYRAYDPANGNLVFTSANMGIVQGHDLSIGAGRIWVATENASRDLIYSIDIVGGAIDQIIECHSTYTDPGYTATDNCGTPSVVVTGSVNANVPGTYTLSYKATDNASNSTTVTRTVTVLDRTPPVASVASLPVITGQCSASVISAPTANDVCGGTITATTTDPLTYNSQGTFTIHWTYKDASGNTSTQNQSVIVKDDQKPTITAPANVSVNNDAGKCSAVVNPGAPLTGDNCGVASVTNNHASNIYPVGTTTVTWTVTDTHGNSSVALQTITVTDNENPTIISPANVSVNNTPGKCTATVSLGSPSTGDNCGIASVTNDHASNIYPVGTTTVTWTVTDIHGNSSIATQTVIVTDDEKPTITAPANVSVNNDEGKCSATVSLGSPSTGDNCGVASVTNDHASNIYPVGTTTVTWTVTDIHGNSSTAIQTVIVSDNEKPTIISPENVSVNNTPGKCEATVELGTPVAADNCGVASVTNDHASNIYPVGATTVTWTVTDIHGNSSIATQNVIVADNEKPTIISPENVSVNNAPGKCEASVELGMPSTGDNCGVASVTNDHASNSYPVGTTIVTWTVTDIHGNSSTAIQTVTVADNERPTIISPENVSVNNTPGKCEATVSLSTPSTGDNCGVASITNDHASNIYPVGTTTVTWTVTDIHGNSSIANQTVIVTDNENPTITALANVSVNNTLGKCEATVELGTPVAADNCGVASVTNDHASSIYPVGTTTVTWTATDIHGNSSIATQTVTVTDNENPTTISPANVSANNTSGKCEATVSLGTPSTGDNCGVASVTNDHASNIYPVGTTIVTWTVTDIHGNSSIATQTVIVTDNEKPAITAPANVSVNNTPGKCEATVSLGTPSTGDNCGVASVTNNHASNIYPVGTTTVTWTVTDIHGNSSTAIQTVTVTDNEKPTIISPENVSVNNTLGKCEATVSLGTPSTGDNCGVASVTNDHASNIYPVGTTIVTWTVTDIHGNSSIATQSVTVTDNEKPTIISPENVSVNNTPGKCEAAVSLGTPATGDNCGVASVTNNHASSIYPVGATTVTWTVTDIHGNSSMATQIVTVIDNEKPAITAVNVNVNNDLGKCSAVVNITSDAKDNCGVASVTNDHPSNIYPVGTTTVNWTVTDTHGNSNSTSQAIIVTDNEKPVTVCPPAQVFCANTGGNTQYTIPALVASDNCGIASVKYIVKGATTRSGSSSNASGTFNAGVSTVIFTVTDIHNNLRTDSFTVRVNSLPVASLSSSNADMFCNSTTLTGSSTLSGPFGFQWLYNNVPVASGQQLSLGLTNADGVYSLYTLDGNGCRSEFGATYNFQKQNVASSYTILGFKGVDLGEANLVQTGSVGVRDAKQEMTLKKNVSVASPGAFVKAPKLNLSSPVNLPVRIIGQAAPALPTMFYNTTSTKGLQSYSVKANTTTTLNGNYKNLYIYKGANVTLNGTVFGRVTIEATAKVTFTKPVVNINSLRIGSSGGENDDDDFKGKYYGQGAVNSSVYTLVSFAPNSQVLISKGVNVSRKTKINPEGYKVTFYAGYQSKHNGWGDGDDDRNDHELDENVYFNVSGTDVKLVANIYMPNGQLNIDDEDGDDHEHDGRNLSTLPTYMTGMFIASRVEGDSKGTIWNSYNCSASNVIARTSSNVIPSAPEQLSVKEEEKNLAVAFKVKLRPNPTTTHFVIHVETSSKAPASIRITDALGRIHEVKDNVVGNTDVIMGDNLKGGIYFIEVLQGNNHEIVKGVKLN